jgi:hypothetical protein
MADDARPRHGNGSGAGVRGVARFYLPILSKALRNGLMPHSSRGIPVDEHCQQQATGICDSEAARPKPRHSARINAPWILCQVTALPSPWL